MGLRVRKLAKERLKRSPEELIEYSALSAISATEAQRICWPIRWWRPYV